MINSGGLEFDKNMFEVVFDQDNVKFLDELSEKIEKNNKEIQELEEKKQKIVEKIASQKQQVEHEPKEQREYISNSESVMESIDAVYKNLIELQNNYKSIEESLLIATQKNAMDSNNIFFEAEAKTLLQKIELTKIYEVNIKNDNEKNYFIINSFLDKTENDTSSVKTPVNFYNLTKENLQDNMVLKKSKKRVELPYTKREIEQFMEKYPEEYQTVQEVIAKEFMINIASFNKHPALSRFRESYYLCRNKEMMPIFDSFGFAKRIMFRSEINPYIIAASKSKKQLEDYIKCLENNKLEDFKHFKIIFEVNPLSF